MPAHARNTKQAYARKASATALKPKKQCEPDRGVTEKVRSAVDAMVVHGQTRAEAAQTAGMTDDGLRKALLKPDVLRYLNEQTEVLRLAARPRALHTIIKLSDKAGSERVQLDAAKYLDGMDRQATTVGAQQINVNVSTNVSLNPGYVIDLVPESAQQIEHLGAHEPNPLVSQGDVPDDE